MEVEKTIRTTLVIRASCSTVEIAIARTRFRRPQVDQTKVIQTANLCWDHALKMVSPKNELLWWRRM